MNDVNTTLDGLKDELGNKKLPPVTDWHPENVGEIDIRILRDGRWLHEGDEIKKPALVRLFSTVLRKDPEGIFLVTPQQKLKISVEDAPFFVNTLTVEEQGGTEQRLVFGTITGDRVIAGPQNSLWVEENPLTGEPSPYIHVRQGMNALLSRVVFYELIDLGEITGKEMVVKSAHEVFSLGKISES